MRQFKTTQSLIASRATNLTVGTITETLGYSSPGDGGGAQWKFEGVTGQTPSQSPADLGDALINDANGNQWELIQDEGQIQVLKIGSVEDGVTDDSASYQAALNSAEKSILATKTPRIGGLTCRHDIGFFGVLKGSTKIFHDASISTDMLVVIPPADANIRNGRFEAKGFTVEVEGEARSAIRLPKSLETYQSQFTFDIDININLYNLGPDGYTEGIRVGDCAKGNIKGEFRAGYIPTAADTGQYNSCPIFLDADRGCIGVQINIMAVNNRRSIAIGNFVENFYINDSELVNTYIGVDTDELADDKPGGFFGPNLHINSNHRGLRINSRRDYNITSCQFYRNSTYFDDGVKWAGIESNSATRFAISNCTWRNVKAAANDACIDLANCSNFSISTSSCGDETGIDAGFSIDGCSNFNIDNTSFAESYGKWFILNNCGNYNIGSHSSDDLSLSDEVYSITNSINGGFIDREGASKNKFLERSFSSSSSFDESINELSTDKTINLTAGGGAYTVDIIMPPINALKGDVMTYLVKFATSSGNPTINFKDGASTRYTINTSAIEDYSVKLVYNGAGWVEAGLTLAS